jgi:hypothetical protein
MPKDILLLQGNLTSEVQNLYPCWFEHKTVRLICFFSTIWRRNMVIEYKVVQFFSDVS